MQTGCRMSLECFTYLPHPASKGGKTNWVWGGQTNFPGKKAYFFCDPTHKSGHSSQVFSEAGKAG